MLAILISPNPVLSQIAKPLKSRGGQLVLDKHLLAFIDDMKETLVATKDPEGVGLAAPQVGKSLQLFITKPTDRSSIAVFINPKIIFRGSTKGIAKRPKKKRVPLEGCLSVPTIWGYVKRDKEVTLSYFDEKGTHRQKIFKGFLATIIQHEIDHLHGILFPKHVLEQKEKLYKSTKDEKGQDVFEEIVI